MCYWLGQKVCSDSPSITLKTIPTILYTLFSPRLIDRVERTSGETLEGMYSG